MEYGILNRGIGLQHACVKKEALPVKALIAHQQILVRKGLREILFETFPSVEVDAAESGPEAIDKCRHTLYDVVLIDLRISGGGVLQVLEQIRHFDARQKILVFNHGSHKEEDEAFSMRVIRGGALGYLGISVSENEIKEGVRRVFAGKQFLSGNLADGFFDLMRQGEKPGTMDSLSDRELQVFHLLRQGKTVKEVADDLFLGAKTVYTHRERIRRKLRVKSDRGLAMAMETTYSGFHG